MRQDTDSHFHEALLHWQELNLAPAFLKFARDADPLSASMPLLLHNWKEIVELWFGALEESDDEADEADVDEAYSADMRWPTKCFHKESFFGYAYDAGEHALREYSFLFHLMIHAC